MRSITKQFVRDKPSGSLFDALHAVLQVIAMPLGQLGGGPIHPRRFTNRMKRIVPLLWQRCNDLNHIRRMVLAFRLTFSEGGYICETDCS